jgi:hypothetical protein
MVSVIQNQTIRTKLSATQAMLMNPIAPPKFPATRLKNVVLRDAPTPRERPNEALRQVESASSFGEISLTAAILT